MSKYICSDANINSMPLILVLCLKKTLTKYTHLRKKGKYEIGLMVLFAGNDVLPMSCLNRTHRAALSSCDSILRDHFNPFA